MIVKVFLLDRRFYSIYVLNYNVCTCNLMLIKAKLNKITKDVNEPLSNLQQLTKHIRHLYQLNAKEFLLTYKLQTGQSVQLKNDHQVNNLKQRKHDLILNVEIINTSNNHNNSFQSKLLNESNISNASSYLKMPIKQPTIEERPSVACRMCKQRQIIGKRWKCTVCKDYDLCDKCFNDRKVRGHHKYSNHEFYRIQSGDFWNTINYAGIVDLFFMLKGKVKQEKFLYWLNQKDIQNNSDAFKMLIKNKKNIYADLIEENMQKWKEQYMKKDEIQ